MKGMVFAGCSFTWGEGLHLYSDVSNIVYTKNQNFNIHNIKLGNNEKLSLFT